MYRKIPILHGRLGGIFDGAEVLRIASDYFVLYFPHERVSGICVIG